MRPEERRSVNCLRALVMDAVERAGNGHPGAAMALAPVAYVLFGEFLRFDPSDPQWPDRDRFVLSCGHAAMLLYGTLHLCGYEVSLDDLRHLRQWGSATPGHPERGRTPGVEVTTGPLGQGFANAVGMAMAESLFAGRDGSGARLVDHRTWVLFSDGELMEGVVAEAASLAGHLRLRKLVALYDCNGVTIDGASSLALSEDVRARFEAYGWRTDEVADVDDLDRLRSAFGWASAQDADQPSLVVLHSHIARGAPHLEDSPAAHGAPLGADEVRATKAVYGLDPEATFDVPAEVYRYWRRAVEAGRSKRAAWLDELAALRAHDPDEAALVEGTIPDALPAELVERLGALDWGDRPWSTREASGRVLGELAGCLPSIVGGCADLTDTTFSALPHASISEPGHVGRFTHFGVREHAMAAICNGMAAHGSLRPYCSTFLVFSDYMRPSVRLSALMRLPVVYLYSHDSIGLAGDGPTHQPVEQLASLRAMPNLVVIRPADATEVALAWQVAIERSTGPTAIVLTRQELATFDRSRLADASGVRQGAYVLAEASRGEPRVSLLASGSEVSVALGARAILEGEGVPVRVVSMPSWELFEEQPERKQEVVLGSNSLKVAVEAAATFGWERWVGAYGVVVGIDRFGACGQGTEVLERFGFTAEHVAEVVRQALRSAGARVGEAGALAARASSKSTRNACNAEEERSMTRATEVDVLAHGQGDDVAIAVHDVEPGPVTIAFLDDSADRELKVNERLPLGHKVALVDLDEGDAVVEYGVQIGVMTKPVHTGDLVHVHNLRSARWQRS